MLVVKLPDVSSCRVPFATTGIRDCNTPGSACPVTVKLVLLLGTIRTFTGAQTCIVEKGSTFTTAIGKAAEGAEGAAAELVAGKVICAAAGTAMNTAIQAVTASSRQPRMVLIILIASVRGRYSTPLHVWSPEVLRICRAVVLLFRLAREKVRWGVCQCQQVFEDALLAEAVPERSCAHACSHAYQDTPRVVTLHYG